MKRNQSIINNPHCRHRSLWKLLGWVFGFYKEKATSFQHEPDFTYPNERRSHNKEDPWIQWINHSTFLIHASGFHFLTDPIWSLRCSPLQFIGPCRLHEPPLALESLPHIDFVLISHDHYDHLDHATVRKLHDLQPHIIWLVPKGVKSWFTKRGITQVQECTWWESIFFHNLKINFTFVPSQHFSGRSLGRANRTLWGGWVVELPNHKKFYFVGDTGYNQYDFKVIGERFKSFDLCLIPIGAYRPRKVMRAMHIDPKEAVIIHKEVGSKLSVGSHWRTFCLSEEKTMEPPYELFHHLKQEGMTPQVFRVLDPGQSINW